MKRYSFEIRIFFFLRNSKRFKEQNKCHVNTFSIKNEARWNKSHAEADFMGDKYIY